MCEELNISMARLGLVVHRKTQVSTVRGELKRYPIGLDIITKVIQYHMHLQTKEEHTILHKALDLNQHLAAKHPDSSKLWYNTYKTVLVCRLIEFTPENIDDRQ